MKRRRALDKKYYHTPRILDSLKILGVGPLGLSHSMRLSNKTPKGSVYSLKLAEQLSFHGGSLLREFQARRVLQSEGSTMSSRASHSSTDRPSSGYLWILASE